MTTPHLKSLAGRDDSLVLEKFALKIILIVSDFNGVSGKIEQFKKEYLS